MISRTMKSFFNHSGIVYASYEAQTSWQVCLLAAEVTLVCLGVGLFLGFLVVDLEIMCEMLHFLRQPDL